MRKRTTLSTMLRRFHNRKDIIFNMFNTDMKPIRKPMTTRVAMSNLTPFFIPFALSSLTSEQVFELSIYPLTDRFFPLDLAGSLSISLISEMFWSILISRLFGLYFRSLIVRLRSSILASFSYISFRGICMKIHLIQLMTSQYVGARI